MTQPSLLSVVRAILTADSKLPMGEIIQRVRSSGLKVADKAVKKAVYNVRSEPPKPAAPKPAPAAAAKASKPAPVVASKTAAPAPSIAPAPAVDLTSIFTNVALVNSVVGECGGVNQARQVAEAVRACGSVDAFLQHLELVAGIRTKA